MIAPYDWLEVGQGVERFAGCLMKLRLPGSWGDETEIVGSGTEIRIAAEVLSLVGLVPDDDVGLISEYDGFAARADAGTSPGGASEKRGAEGHRVCF